jgi:hypothetical protein
MAREVVFEINAQVNGDFYFFMGRGSGDATIIWLHSNRNILTHFCLGGSVNAGLHG